jgi:hypothetical protein
VQLRVGYAKCILSFSMFSELAKFMTAFMSQQQQQQQHVLSIVYFWLRDARTE